MSTTPQTRFTFDRKAADAARARGAIVRMVEGVGDDGSDLPAWSIVEARP